MADTIGEEPSPVATLPREPLQAWLAPAFGDDAYVPAPKVRAYVQEMVADMNAMKAKCAAAIEQVEARFREAATKAHIYYAQKVQEANAKYIPEHDRAVEFERQNSELSQKLAEAENQLVKTRSERDDALQRETLGQSASPQQRPMSSATNRSVEMRRDVQEPMLPRSDSKITLKGTPQISLPPTLTPPARTVTPVQTMPPADPPHAGDSDTALLERIAALESQLAVARQPRPSTPASGPARTEPGAATTTLTGPAPSAADNKVALNAGQIIIDEAEIVRERSERARVEQEIVALRSELATAKTAAAQAESDTKSKAAASTSELKAQLDAAKRAAAEEATRLDAALKEARDQSVARAKELAALQAAHSKQEEDMRALSQAAVEADTFRRNLEATTAELETCRTEKEEVQAAFKAEQVKRKALHNKIEDMLGKIRVYVRVRPMGASELERGSTECLTYPDEFTIVVNKEDGKTTEYNFDQVFSPTSTQDQVYENTKNLIQSALDGFNVCIFAYGQTGSGKTFTMAGDAAHPGIIPRSFEQIFSTFRDQRKVFKYSMKVYMLEIYNKKLIDLLLDPRQANDPPDLQIKKDSKGMVFVNNVTTRKAQSVEDLHSILEEGTTQRHTGATKMNNSSSRSHLIFSMVIEAKNLTNGQTHTGKLSLVDLAGSESVGKTEAEGERLKEAQAINSSLSALGNVISKLAKEEAYIPYRDDKLTLLMMDSLGGNAKTLMFVNLSPADYNRQETNSSLIYSARVKEIKNQASRNVETEEVKRLKKKIKQLMGGAAAEDSGEDLEGPGAGAQE